MIRMSHHVKPTHQVSFLSVDSFWVQLFVELLFSDDDHEPDGLQSVTLEPQSGPVWSVELIKWTISVR